ncbi:MULTISPECIES: sensor histidine kinase [Dyella]|nr:MULTISPECIES: sensor histidine kinase [Dyella]
MLTPRPDSLLGQLNSPMHLIRAAFGQSLWLIVLFLVPWGARGFAWFWFLPTLASVAVYLYLHAQVFLGPMRRLVWYAAGMVLLGLAVWPVNSVGFGYLICAGSALSTARSLKHWLVGVVLITLISLPMVLWLQAPMWVMLVVLVSGILGGSNNYLYIRNLRKDAQLRLSQDEVRRLATLAERERIGRDLHDLLGHTLSLVAIKSELARRLAIKDPERAQREMTEVERVARHALSEVRAAVTGMRRSDLAAELVSARLMLEASGVSFEAAFPAGMCLPASIETSLALVLREAVTNIHRHADARTAWVTFALDDGAFRMCIRDNGRGGLGAHGNGVSGMRERVRALHGTLDIDSPPRRGTTLSVCVPVNEATAGHVPEEDTTRTFA